MDRSSGVDRSLASRPPGARSNDTFPDDEVARALAGAVRAALARGEEAAVPGLGTFRTEHRASRIERRNDGTLAVHPPRRTVTFDPEASPDAA